MEKKYSVKQFILIVKNDEITIVLLHFFSFLLCFPSLLFYFFLFYRPLSLLCIYISSFLNTHTSLRLLSPPSSFFLVASLSSGRPGASTQPSVRVTTRLHVVRRRASTLLSVRVTTRHHHAFTLFAVEPPLPGLPQIARVVGCSFLGPRRCRALLPWLRRRCSTTCRRRSSPPQPTPCRLHSRGSKSDI